MRATEVSIYYRFFDKKRFVGMTLSNSNSNLDVKVLSYADKGLVLQQIGGYAQDSSFLRVRDIIELMLGCFEEQSNFGRERERFYGKGCQYVNAITMSIYGIHITANRYGFGKEELWKQWIELSNRRALANIVE